MVKAIRIHEHGGPEKLVWEDVDVGAPGEGEIRVKHRAVGLNFIDTYQRSGLYPLASLPAVMGMEGAGEVVAVGSGVDFFTYTAKRADLLANAADLFEVVENGMVKIKVNQTYPLAEAAQAHRDLESRATTGSTVFAP